MAVTMYGVFVSAPGKKRSLRTFSQLMVARVFAMQKVQTYADRADIYQVRAIDNARGAVIALENGEGILFETKFTDGRSDGTRRIREAQYNEVLNVFSGRD